MADRKKTTARRLAGHVVFDAETVELTIDGEAFPFAVAEAGPTLVDISGELLPAVELKLVCGSLEVISARTGGDLRGNAR